MLGRLLAFSIFCLLPQMLFAQLGTISGKVTDKKDKSVLIGVNVVLKGTTLGASTNIDGVYKIQNIPAGSYTVEISYLGYQKQLISSYKVEKGQNLTLDVQLVPTDLTFDQEVVVTGTRPIVDIEVTKTETKISAEVIDAAPARQIQGILNTQTGVVLNPEGISIRGGRTYETAFLVDGVSASDPLAGTGFGIDLGANSIDNLNVTTGGGDVQYGDGTAGIVNAQTKSGGDKLDFSFGSRRDRIGINNNWAGAWNNSIYESTLGGSTKIAGKKLRIFSSFRAAFDDQYFRTPANQVVSSIYRNTAYSPAQDNRWSAMLKLDYEISPKQRLSFTYLRSITINQDVNMLRILGNDVPFLPGYQFDFSLQPDNAATFTHNTNLQSLKWSQTVTNKFAHNVTGSRLYVNLRADANGRDWRPQTVDGEFDPNVIINFPVTVFNPGDSVVFANPGPGLFNNGGITPLWHDHYVTEYTLRYNGNYYTNSSGNRFSFGTEVKFQELQWIDISRPWIGAPIPLPNGETTQSFRLGDYSDVWKVSPTRGAFYASQKIKHRGLVIEIGARLEYWFPGKFVDDAIDNPRAPIADLIRENYKNDTYSLFGNRFKARILPKISASFPIKENQVMYFNYNHSMILPHASFVYAGLDPFYQDRSTLSRIGNPNLDPEVDISYELGLRSQITNDDALTVSAYWKDKYDFITSSSLEIPDQTGRLVNRTIRINSDYARVRGVEVSYLKRVNKWFTGQLSASYSIATGQSSSANESLNQILNTGNRQDTKELFLAWDSPLDIKTFAVFTHDAKKGLFDIKQLNRVQFYVEGIYRSGRRYTPFIFIGDEPITGRPIYERDPNPDAVNSKLGASMFWVDLNFKKWWYVGQKKHRIEGIIEITNVFNNRNTNIPNPVTGRGYEFGDPVPGNWRDPNFLDPRDRRSQNQPPDNPARFRAPRHVMFGINFKL